MKDLIFSTLLKFKWYRNFKARLLKLNRIERELHKLNTRQKVTNQVQVKGLRGSRNVSMKNLVSKYNELSFSFSSKYELMVQSTPTNDTVVWAKEIK